MLLDSIPDKLKNLDYAIYPCDPSYNEKRFIYNKLWNYYPNAIFYPKDKCDVEYVLKHIIKNKLKFTLRAGGHSYEAASLNDYIIDVSNLSNIEIDKDKKIVSLDCGVKLGELIDKLKIEKLICATGESPTVGIGLFLQGGKGYMSRLLGMCCDNVIEFKMMNYKGKILTVNSKQNSDLFWALKGSGANNYGIVLSYKIKAYKDLYMRLITLSWSWNSEKIIELFTLYFKWIETVNNNISTDVIISYSNGVASVKIMFFKFTKKPSKNFDEINEFVNFQNPTITKCKGYYSQKTDCWVNPENGYDNVFSKLKSTMIFEKPSDEFTKLLINSIDNLIDEKQNITYKYNFTQLNGKVVNGNSCYYPKNALLSLTIPCSWSNPNLTAYAETTIKKYYDDIITYTSQYVFPNMIDYDLEDYMNAYYGDNANKLYDIKIKYDPNYIFTWRQVIK
jgi:hypothetical protein